jgi:TolB-like protein/Tfp pilus assembly protein PilF
MFSELKRRKVVRVAGVYTVTAWGLFQVAKTVLEVLSFPRWTSSLVLLLLVAGLPFALIMAWAFERGPDGHLRPTVALQADQPRPKVAWSDLALLLLTAGVLLVSGLQVAGVVRGPSAGDRSAPSSARSVAVLPFASFSADPDAAFFSDGLTEEIINSLAQTPDLKVAGRTSAFYFKGKNEDIREIGKRLGVAHVVEGSVRRDRDRLRVTAQLIKVSDGFHLWSQTYDRRMDDAFGIQTEIAEAVAQALQSELTPRSKRRGARDPDAYQLEVTALAYLRHWGLEELQTARSRFDQLRRLEPHNADAYAGFATATVMLMQNYAAIDFERGREQAQAAVARALELNPESARAHTADGFLNYIIAFRGGEERHNRRAEMAFRKALAINPRDPDALVLYGNFLSQQGRTRESLAHLRHALQIDPLNRVAQTVYAAVLSRSGDIHGAEAQYRATLELYPDFVDARTHLGELLMETGRLAQAEPWLRSAAAPLGDPAAMLPLIQLYTNLGLDEDASAGLRQMANTPLGAAVAQAIPLVRRGDYRALVRLADAQIERSNDPFWRQVAGSGALLSGDAVRAHKELAFTSPALFLPEPAVTLDRLSEALAAAHIAQAEGDSAQAKRLLRRVLQVAAPRIGLHDGSKNRIVRVRAYAQLGDHDRAVAELRAAVDAGYRTLWDVDYIRLEHYPGMAALSADPRFKAAIAEIEADLRRQRDDVLASRR